MNDPAINDRPGEIVEIGLQELSSLPSIVVQLIPQHLVIPLVDIQLVQSAEEKSLQALQPGTALVVPQNTKVNITNSQHAARSDNDVLLQTLNNKALQTPQNLPVENICEVSIINQHTSHSQTTKNFNQENDNQQSSLHQTNNFTCNLCGKAFVRKGSFETHRHREHKISCCPHPNCGKEFTQRHRLLSHMFNHRIRGQKRFQCEYCPVQVDTSSSLKVHLRIHTGERPYCCEECGERFRRRQALQKHRASVHLTPGRSTFQCRFCNSCFNDVGNLRRHILRVHHDFRRFICGVCGSQYGQNQDLRRHAKQRHDIDLPAISSTEKKTANEVYVLPLLKDVPENHAHTLKIQEIVATEMKKVESLSQYLQSIPAVHVTAQSSVISETVMEKPPIPEIQAVPEVLNKDLEKSSEPAISDVKKPTKVFPCNVCQKTCLSLRCLKRHTKIHKGSKPYICTICGKSFAEKCNLTVHFRSHTGERPYQCKVCGKKMRYRKEVTDHYHQHVGVKPYKCNTCGKKFLRQRELVRHCAVHGKRERYACSVCGKTFARLDHLNRVHAKTHMELAEPAFKCSVCDKKFEQRTKLQQHLVLHSGKKQYLCTICQKAFALPQYLKAHLAVHEKQKGYHSCPECSRMFSSVETLETHKTKFHSVKEDSKVLYLNFVPDLTSDILPVDTVCTPT